MGSPERRTLLPSAQRSALQRARSGARPGRRGRLGSRVYVALGIPSLVARYRAPRIPPRRPRVSSGKRAGSPRRRQRLNSKLRPPHSYQRPSTWRGCTGPACSIPARALFLMSCRIPLRSRTRRLFLSRRPAQYRSHSSTSRVAPAVDDSIGSPTPATVSDSARKNRQTLIADERAIVGGDALHTEQGNARTKGVRPADPRARVLACNGETSECSTQHALEVATAEYRT